jgi:Ca2+-binding EF-hand superfamily protein
MGDSVSSLGEWGQALSREACCSSTRRAVETDAERAARDAAHFEKLKHKLNRLNLQLDEFVEQEISSLFADADADGSDAISTEEANQLVGLLKEHNFEFTIDMRSFDSNRNGNIEKEEFEAAVRTALFDRPDNLEVLVQSCEDVENLLEEAWDDVYASTTTPISVADVARLMRELLVELGHADTPIDLNSKSGSALSPRGSPASNGAASEDLPTQVGKFDGDEDGQLTRDEFFKAYNKFLMRIYYLPAATPLVAKSRKSCILKKADKDKDVKGMASL